MQSYGFKSLAPKGKNVFGTIRQPAGASPLRSLYASSFQNPVSDVLSSSQAARMGAGSLLGAHPYAASTQPLTHNEEMTGGTTYVPPSGGATGNANPPVSAPPAQKQPTINDLTADPILAFLQSSGNKDVADITSGGLAAAKNAIIGAGLSSVPDSLKALFAGDPSNPILGALTDQGTLDAAAQNPDSALKQIGKANELAVSDVNAQSNAGNAFYGSRHAEGLTHQADLNRQAQEGIYGGLGGSLGQLYQSILAAKRNASDQYANALPGAWQRYIDSQQPPADAPVDTSSNGPAGPTTINDLLGGDGSLLKPSKSKFYAS